MPAIDDATSAKIKAAADAASPKRRQILDGACKVFLDLGFDGGSMGDIARAARVSKGTLYAYFSDKRRLFEAIVEEEALKRRQLAFYFDAECDTKTTLQRFGEAYIGMLCRPDSRSAARMVIAIAERMPEVGRCYYEMVLRKTADHLAEYLDARVKREELAIDDCQLAAAQFMLLCQATMFQPFIFAVTPPPSQDHVAHVVGDAVQTFLAAHRVNAV
jgi:AcrR family transcriptional regulator